MVRCALVLIVFAAAGCVSQAKQALAPEPEGGGTLSCREIVEQCDAQCSDPLCLHQCTPQGLPEARTEHDALLDCGQSHGCTDQACMEQSCGAEVQACMGPSEPDAAPAAPAAAAEGT